MKPLLVATFMTCNPGPPLPSYTYKALKTLDGYRCGVYDVNASGVISGYCNEVGGSAQVPVVWPQASADPIALPLATSTTYTVYGMAAQLNDNGLIVGSEELYLNGTWDHYQTVLWSPQSGGGYSRSVIYPTTFGGVVPNNHGDVLGGILNGNYYDQKIWNAATNTFTPVGTTPGDFLVAFNDNREVVTEQCEYWSNGVVTQLPAPSGVSSTQPAARAMNNAGTIVGTADEPSGNDSRGVVWKKDNNGWSVERLPLIGVPANGRSGNGANTIDAAGNIGGGAYRVDHARTEITETHFVAWMADGTSIDFGPLPFHFGSNVILKMKGLQGRTLAIGNVVDTDWNAVGVYAE